MKKRIILLGLSLVIFLSLLSCEKKYDKTYESTSDSYAEDTVSSEKAESDHNPRGGTSICQVHSLLSYHGYSQEMINLVGEENFNSWAEKTSVPDQKDGCLYPDGNILSFIRFFNIPRDELERVYYQSATYYGHVLNLDLLYSGDEKAVDEYYRNSSIKDVEEKREQFLILKMAIRDSYNEEWVDLFGDSRITPQKSVYEAVKAFGIDREKIESLVEENSNNNSPSYHYNFDVLFDESLEGLPPIEQDAAFCGISDYITE